MRLTPSRAAFLVLATLAILIATLWPFPGEPNQLTGCLVCGDDVAADLLCNVILFLPFGAALAHLGWRRGRAALAGALLSATVECAQLFVPGRDTSLRDVLSNTTGAMLGAILVGAAPRWLWPGPRAAARLSRAAALGAVAVCAATGALAVPALPPSEYYSMWTPQLEHLEHYRGRVLDASIAPTVIPPGPIAASAAVRERLTGRDAVLHVRAVAGRRPAALAPLLAIYDDKEREILLLGVERDAVVFWLRSRAAALGLDQPDIRLRNGMRGVAADDTIDVGVAGAGNGAHGYSLRVNGRTESGLGPTVGSGWALLMYPETLPPWGKALLSATWLAAVFLPVGLWIRSRGDVLTAAAAVAAAVLGVPALTPLVATPALEWVGAAAGILAGVGLHLVISRPPGPAARHAATP